jgi:hypothetical protein
MDACLPVKQLICINIKHSVMKKIIVKDAMGW